MASPRLPAAIVTPTSDFNHEDLRRLLLYEVLLEEYESHCQFKETSSSSPESETNPAGVPSSYTPRNQPPLFKEQVDLIKNLGKHFEAMKKALPENEREDFESKSNGQLVSMVLQLMVRAQKQASEEEFKTLWAKYQETLKGPGSTDLSEEERRIVKKAVIADIQGVVDDYCEQYRRELTETAGVPKPGDPAVEKAARDYAFRHVIEEEQSAADARDPSAPKPDIDPHKLISQPTRDPNAETPKADSVLPKSSGNGDAAVSEKPGRDIDRAQKAMRLDARTRRSALCLSGGGIRSATFNLGILQGLARHGLLGQFDYLSTVSGGGFAGGFLTAWAHRVGTKKVLDDLTQPPKSPLQTEPHPIDHLRVFGNYLSLRPGLLSADTWTLIATVLRNLLLTWLVFVPFLLLMLMAPRLWAVLLAIKYPPVFKLGFLIIGIFFGWISLGYTTYALSKKHSDAVVSASNYKSDEGQFLWLCLLPAMFSAMAFALCWAHLSVEQQQGRSWGIFVALMILLVGPVWVAGYLFRLYQELAPRLKSSQDYLDEGEKIIENLQTTVIRHAREIAKFIFRWLLILLSQLIAGFLLYLVAKHLLPSYQAHPQLYATFAVPLLMLNVALACTLIAGFNSGFTLDDDQEWWARYSAWFFIIIMSWSAAHVLVLYGPRLVLSLGHTFRLLWEGNIWSTNLVDAGVKIFALLVGIMSGVITLMAGFSPKSPANDDKAGSASPAGLMLEKLSSLVAPIFLAFLIVLLAIGTDALLTSGLSVWLIKTFPRVFLQTTDPETISHFINTFVGTFPGSHAALVRTTPFALLIVMGIFIAIVGTLMGLLINSNTFSLHYMWRNRIIRAYLGASRVVRNPDNFTGFDVNDNIHMHELRPQPAGVVSPEIRRPDGAKRSPDIPCPRKLFHILNIALNLAGGDKLAWQDRKAESFTVSPLHVGSYWLGYRRSTVYGGERGISLGTAVAISGAFVSPNMGYMMTSPIVRFLMTLFNVRFGWWLGNPGDAGDKTRLTEKFVAGLRSIFFGKKSGKPFELKSPLLSVTPIVQEAFGKTDDKAPYVYLSDGGHFENLGLYEMVLRRCRFIVVSDASTDAGYSFDSLAQSIRQIRVDLGIPIDIEEMSIIPPAQDLRGKYCAIGTIRYSCVDRPSDSDLHREDYDGILIYIKASMIGDEPRDVINYEQSSKDFPQEVIVDQWFSESQFESYRALGSHIIDAICGGDQNKINLAAFARKVKEHNRVNFRVFKEQISLAALQDQFKRAMEHDTPKVYQDKVKAYLKDLLDIKMEKF
jgi:Patatin-like phospholipase